MVTALLAFVTTHSVPTGPPTNFIISVTSRTLNLSWSPPLPSKRNGVIVHYIIICRSGGSTISTSTNASINGNEYRLTGLQPAARYSCSVSASTVVGAGPAATLNVITDKESEISTILYHISHLGISYRSTGPGPPHSLSASKGSTSVSLMWNMPLEPNGVIVEYEVQCTGRGKMFLVTVTGSQTTAILTELVPYTNYSCSITAYTSVGGGPAATIIVNTEQDSKPQTITVYDITLLQITVCYHFSSSSLQS